MSDNIALYCENKIACLIFDRPESSANIFDEKTLDELDEHLTEIEKNRDLKGLIVESHKDTIFIAGADIHTLSKASAEELDNFLIRGQQLFNRIEDLSIPTVAAIHGTAVGGGLEIALACDWRIASDAKATKVGLPETQLGILPAWGGSTRLPKLIGLQAALSLILKGNTINAGKAKHLGLVDAVAPRARMRKLAETFISKGSPSRNSHFLQNNRVAASIIRKKAKSNVIEKTHGNYPAPIAAIDVACASVYRDREASLQSEREAALQLAESEVTRNLMRIYFLTEKSKRLRLVEKSSREIERVCVLGAGVMGSGIAHWLSTRGVEVLLQDINAEAVARGVQTCQKLRDGMVKRRLVSTAEASQFRDRIRVSSEPVPLQDYDMVIEAAVENLEIKKKIFSDLCKRTSKSTILATNTSALPITELASHDGITNPERVVGLHFFNPVHMMKLVEVVAAEQSSKEACNNCIRFVQKIGKLPVYTKDRPGFIVNRILMPYLIEAGELFDRGASARLVDQAMLSFGMPMGPIRLIDEVGLDVARHVSATMADAFAGRFGVPAILDVLIERKQIGRKSGAGFYIYTKGSKEKANEQASSLSSGTLASDLSETAISQRLSLLMINEAWRCLEEGVSDDADAIDFAMIMGAGFAPFRGGPISYSKELGLTEVANSLQELDAQAEGDRFAPCELLITESQK